jgi:peptidoglycan hydrolase CwlO-like protein
MPIIETIEIKDDSKAKELEKQAEEFREKLKALDGDAEAINTRMDEVDKQILDI